METVTLARTVRDPSGMVHKPGERAALRRFQLELGTHRNLLVCEWLETQKRVILLPEDTVELGR